MGAEREGDDMKTDSGFPFIELMCSADDRHKLADDYGRGRLDEVAAMLSIGQAEALTMANKKPPCDSTQNGKRV